MNWSAFLEFQFIISEILGHHNQGWPRKLHFKLFLLNDLLKKPIAFWRFYIYITVCIGRTFYWSETCFSYLLRKTLLLSKFLKDLVANLSHSLYLSVKGMIILVLFRCKLLKFTFNAVSYINNVWILLSKVEELWFLKISEVSSSD